GLEEVNDLMVDDDVEVGREVNFKTILSEYGGDFLEWKNGKEKDNDEKKDAEKKVKSEEEQPQVAEEEDSEPPTVVTMVVTEVAKTDIVLFNQEEVFGEANQGNADQTTVVSVEEQTLEVEKTEDEASQIVLIESKVDVTLKKRHALTEEEINERAIKMACQMNRLHAHLGELLPGVLLISFIQRPISQDKKNQVIDVYIKALMQYFGTQYRACPDNERIVLADIFACQYIGRDFNVWTRNMSSPEGVELKKKLIWEQVAFMQ
ncbi:hypothetical protein GIB67_022447, partial [Kingdonia uniflora]